MSLSQHLLPNNTLAAKSTAYNAFMRFLKDEEMTLEEAHQSIEATANGRGIAVIMDKFAIYLAFGDSTKGAKLAKNTVAGYFGNVRAWLLSKYPQHRLVVEPEVQAVAGRLTKYCKKRTGGAVVQKAPPCRKSDLEALAHCVYKYGSSSSDYLDGLLVSWLWYLLGRSSDLSDLLTSNIAVYPGGALYVRFTRPKTAEESGLALYRDKDSFLTCPITALAVALVMSTSGQREIFTQVPHSDPGLRDEADLLSIPLRDLLDEEIRDGQLGYGVGKTSAPMSRTAGVASPMVHGYVNRLLETLRKRSVDKPIRPQLSSHSFRRGGVPSMQTETRVSVHYGFWIAGRGI